MKVLTKAELWALLARCRRVIQRIVAQNCAMPLDVIDEAHFLARELEEVNRL